jgi:hypothetical protein
MALSLVGRIVLPLGCRLHPYHRALRDAAQAKIAAYSAAQSAGREFIEQTIPEVDPSAVESLRATAQK